MWIKYSYLIENMMLKGFNVKNNNLKACCSVLLLCWALPSFAQDVSHNFSTSLVLGVSEGDSDTNLASDDLMIGYDVAYQYRFDQNWGVEVGFRQVEPEGFTALFNSLVHNDFVIEKASSVRATAVYSWPLSKRNSMYVKVGAQLSSVNYQRMETVANGDITGLVDNDKTSASVYAGLGWRYQFDSGIELGASYDYQDMDIIDAKLFSLNFGYSF